MTQTRPAPAARGSVLPARPGPPPSAGPIARGQGGSGAPYGPPPGGAGAPRQPGTPLGLVGSRVGALVARSTAGTPGRLRLFAALAILVSLTFGLAAAQAFRAESEALGRAGDNARQLVRIQQIHTDLLRADANATNAFLRGGLEPVADRQAYTSSLADAATLIATAARWQPADRQALAALNRTVVTYSGLVEQARAGNRQGLPVGAAYLTSAGSQLRNGALPVLDNLVRANERRTAAEFGSTAQAELWVVVFGILALAALAATMAWVARRTHRVVNTPLALATAVVLVTGVLAVLLLSSLSGHVRSVQRHSYAITSAAADARSAAFDAKSRESLTLIQRGSGAPDEAAWQVDAKVVVRQSGVIDGLTQGANRLVKAWAPYARTHAQVRRLDGAGSWKPAVDLATGTSTASANATFDAYDRASDTTLRQASADTANQLSSSRGWLLPLGILALLLGVLAALLAWWGIALRLEEYR